MECETSTSFPNALLNGLNDLAFTANGDVTNANTQDACVDFFFGVKEMTSASRINELVAAAWKQSPIDTLKLIFYLLDVRDGKSCNKEAITALLWLFKEDQNTFILNLKQVGTFGCYRDLMNLLVQSKMTELQQADLKEKDLKNAMDKKKNRKGERHVMFKTMFDTVRAHKTNDITRLQDVLIGEICRVLQEDKRKLENGDQISLLSKWIPSPGSRIDRMTGLNGLIAQHLLITINPDISKRKLNRASERFRKEYMTPLRKHLQIVETKMSAGEWDAIDYKQVPSQSMTRNRKSFDKHDKEKFGTYLKEAAEGKVAIKIKGGLKPHQITHLMRYETTGVALAEAQWNAYLSDLNEKGSLTNAMAICDVSGSMTSVQVGNGCTALDVSVSLGLLLASVTKAPWGNHLITFSGDPRFHKIQGNTLEEKARFIEVMPWDMNTNFDKVFDLILATAKRRTVPQEDMIKTLFVFSDMEFDAAGGKSFGQTALERIRQKYVEAGYEMPQLIFWNLGSGSHAPATVNDAGIGLVSGFSGNMLNLFLDNDLLSDEGSKEPKLTPREVMRKAIDNERYNVLQLAGDCDR